MFLYIFKDGTIKQVDENPSVADMLAVAMGILEIVTYDKDGKFFKKLSKVQNGEKYIWTELEEADTLICREGRVHQ